MRRPHVIVFSLILAGFILIGPAALHGQTIWYVDDDAPNDPGPGDPLVSDPAEDGSAGHPFDAIQKAVNAAVEGDTVTVADGTYTGHGNRDIRFNGKGITVASENGPEACIIDIENHTSRPGFNFTYGETPDARVEGLTIVNGDSTDGGAFRCDDSSPTISHCTITSNDGPGIYCEYYSSPVISHCTITNNGGEGIYCYLRSSPVISHCTITHNSSSGIHCYGHSSPDISHCTIGNNQAWNGGGINCNADCNPSISQCLIQNNNVSWGSGGGISLNDFCDAEISDCTILGNTAYSNGGGINIKDRSDAVISNCTIQFNSTITVYVYGKGGGISCLNGSTPTIDSCRISDNSSFEMGGGIYCETSPSVIQNCMIQRNKIHGGLTRYGGGILSLNSSPRIIGCTITDHMDLDYGGGFCGLGRGSPVIESTILWNNRASEGSEICLIEDYWYNPLVLDISYSDVKGGPGAVYNDNGTLNWGDGMISDDPHFKPYMPAHLACQLSSDSPCIDMGDPDFMPVLFETDFFGDPRKADGRVDMGADEYFVLKYDCDAGITTVSPSGLHKPDFLTISAHVLNFGRVHQMVPVQCGIYDEFNALVYTAETEVYVESLDAWLVEFESPWYPVEDGVYRISATTGLAGDENPLNDTTETEATILAYTDIAVTSINSPPEVVLAGPCVVSAKIRNRGDREKIVPVQCWIEEDISGRGFGYYDVVDVSIPPHTTMDVTFDTWDAVLGDFIVIVNTSIPGDENPDNNELRRTGTVYPHRDTGIFAIPSPSGEQLPGDHIVRASAANYGGLRQNDVPVVCRIFNWDDEEVYFATASVDIEAFQSKNIEFEPAWHVFEPGDYGINVRTMLPDDEIPENDAHEKSMIILQYNDVGVVSINSPWPPVYQGSQEVNATFENFGSEDLDFRANCSIDVINYSLLQYFNGDFPPAGWTQEQAGEWFQSDSNWAGGTPLEAALESTTLLDDYAYLAPPPVDTTGANELILKFKSRIDRYTLYFFCRVYTRSSETSPWQDVTPWTNPIYQSIEARGYAIDISHAIGPGTQVMFEFDGSFWNINGWYIDAVTIYDMVPVYQANEMIHLPAFSSSDVAFSQLWNATHGRYEIKVTASADGDENPGNDEKIIRVTVFQ